MATRFIENKVVATVEISTDDQVNVSYTGEVLTYGKSIFSTGSGNVVQVYGSVRSLDDIAIVLNDKSDLYVGGAIEGKTGGIVIGAMEKGRSITNVINGRIVASDGTAISGSGRLNVKNGSSNAGIALISGKDYGIFSANGSGDDQNLEVVNYGTIRAVTGIGSSASNDVIENYGTIEGTGGIAVSLGAGNDTYKGAATGAALGTIDMGEGDDTVYVGHSTEVIDGGTGSDTVIFTGSRSNYKITVNGDGSISVVDQRLGGDGDDRAKNVEFLRFSDVTVKVADLVGGPAGNPGTPGVGQTFVGTKAKNTLVGGDGSDKFYGKYGNDKLTGGAGADAFVFDSKLGTSVTDRKVNFDTITDFHVGEDRIWLDNAIFKKLGKIGSEASPVRLDAKNFALKKAKDGNDYIIYKNGVVSYDKDGSGTKYKAVEIVKIANKAALTADSFLIV